MSGSSRSLCGPALAAGLTLVLASAAPAAAEIFDFPGGPRFEDADTAPSRPAKARRPKPQREAKRHDSESKRDLAPAQGPYQLVVSVARQQVTLYGQHGAIAHAPVSTGVPEHPTPLGVFTVISKDKWHKSNIYSGAPMPYMQRITWSGIALHAGALPGYPASHGCIRLPESFAIKLWGTAKIGARVIVTREPAAPVEIAHRNLFVPKKLEPKAVAETAMDAVSIAADPAGAAQPTAAKATAKAAAEVTNQVTDVTVTIVEPRAPADIIKLPDAPKPRAELPKRNEPVQVFVSRKDSKFYVRQGFAPLFDAALTIAEPDKPWGTHVYTVMEVKDDAARWTALSIPSGYTRKADSDRRRRKLSAREIEQEKRAADLAHAPTAAQALERFELPKDAVDRISELLAPGSALIVSDNALSDETDSDTSFIVLTR